MLIPKVQLSLIFFSIIGFLALGAVAVRDTSGQEEGRGRATRNGRGRRAGRRKNPSQSLQADAQKGLSLGKISIAGAVGIQNDSGSGNEEELKQKTTQELRKQLKNHWGGQGQEDLEPKAVGYDARRHGNGSENNGNENGKAHVRFKQRIRGIEVEGASLMVHVDSDGTLAAINGEFLSEDTIEELLPKAWGSNAAASPQELLQQAATEAGIQDGTWSGRPQRAVVRRLDNGEVCLAWKRLVEYTVIETKTGLLVPQMDTIFADSTYTGAEKESDTKEEMPSKFSSDTSSGALCARHPQYYGSGIPSMLTYNCYEMTTCSLVSNSSTPISTGEAAVDAAHNATIATYNYYYDNFGRDSFDNDGLTITSVVNYDEGYNNAFWNGQRKVLVYGTGDGVQYGNFALSLDVVAHEFTHGVTHHASSLVYYSESGAINEAISDIFGAMVARQEGQAGDDIWLIGEDVYTPSTPGDAMRDMADPSRFGDADYYPHRYTGTADNAGVHSNSGIANLAYHLLVIGGTHPRGRTSNVVTGIGFEAAAEIFYNANVNCLTEHSTFEMARFCTAEVFGGDYKENVHQAWDAVGVPMNEPLLPVPMEFGTPLSGQSSEDVILYRIDAPEGFIGSVACTTTGSNGDADLYMRFGGYRDGGYPIIEALSPLNDCASYSDDSNEACTKVLSPSPLSTILFVSVHAFTAYTDLTVLCTLDPPTDLEFDVALDGQSTYTFLLYQIDSILTGDKVKCETTSSAAEGDADLYLRFGSIPAIDQTDDGNACSSYSANSNETCITKSARSDDPLYILVHAWQITTAGEVTDLSIRCSLYYRAPPNTDTPTPPQTVIPVPSPTDNPETDPPTESLSPSTAAPTGSKMSSLSGPPECSIPANVCGSIYKGYMMHKSDSKGHCEARCAYFMSFHLSMGWECGVCENSRNLQEGRKEEITNKVEINNGHFLRHRT